MIVFAEQIIGEVYKASVRTKNCESTTQNSSPFIFFVIVYCLPRVDAVVEQDVRPAAGVACS